jgi:hypothetical protein
MKLRHRLLRWLGVVSPSGAYPLPPRWAMSKLGRSRYYPDQTRSVVASGDGSVAAGGNIGVALTGRGGSVPSMRRVPGASGHRPGASWASDVARGPLTRFSTGDPVHDCGSGDVCARLGCFERQPYVSLRDRQQEGDSSC